MYGLLSSRYEREVINVCGQRQWSHRYAARTSLRREWVSQQGIRPAWLTHSLLKEAPQVFRHMTCYCVNVTLRGPGDAVLGGVSALVP